MNRRTHVVLSEELVKDIDALVGRRRRSSFLAAAAQKELARVRQIEALKGAAGAWEDRDHPELKHGSSRWVKRLRQQSERRAKKASSR